MGMGRIWNLARGSHFGVSGCDFNGLAGEGLVVRCEDAGGMAFASPVELSFFIIVQPSDA
jgi:hypothetical protein